MEYGVMLAGLVAKLAPLAEQWWAAHKAGDAAAMAQIQKMEEEARAQFEIDRANLLVVIAADDKEIDAEIAAARQK